VEGRRAIARRAVVPCATLAALVAAGCGGGERQDAGEKAGTYEVAAVAHFAPKQRVADPELFVVDVRNTGRETVPNVAVTVSSFSARSEEADLADAQRPAWVIDREPRGGATAYVNTWALGPLAPGRAKRFVWRVVAVAPGTHTVKWQVAAGLNGKAKATLAGNRVPAGQFTVDVSDAPANLRVDPATGEVVRSGG
jgi:hypothetical protein